jgi:YbbR domain-containing protein
LLTRNIGWKLLSLALAIVLWMAVVGDPELTKSIPAPIEFTSIPKDLEISSDIPEKVRLEIQGPASRLRNLEKAAVVVNLSSVDRPCERTFPIKETEVDLPSRVVLLRAVPSRLRLRFERVASREVPVEAQFAGPPPEGFRVLRAEVSPSKATITGPESHVNGVAAAKTDAIDLSEVVGEKSFPVSVYVNEPLVRLASAPEVTVKVVMEKIPQEAAPGGQAIIRH